MKKRIILLFIVCSLGFCLFATNDYKVCVFPKNEQLTNDFKEYFDISTNSCDLNCDTSLLLTGDYRLLEYICNISKSNILFIPIKETISEYTYLRLYSFVKETGEFTLEFESISLDKLDFGYEAIESIYNHYLKSSVDNDTLNNNLEKEYSTNSLLLDCSNTEADIYLNDIYLGTTPFVLETYYAPSIIKFCAEGFAGKVCSINNTKQQELKVTLISNLKSNSDSFKKSQNRYYIALASTILGWGSRIAVDALNIKNSNIKNALNYVTLGLAVSSTGFLGYSIYDYFKTTQYTAH